MDYLRLEYEIKRRGFSIGEFAKTIGMSRSTFYHKCRGNSEFTLAEIKRIMSVLEIDDATDIFFADKVS